MITERPAEALELLKKRFSTMDPALLAAAWEVVSKAHAKDIRVSLKGLENSQNVSLEAKLLKPEDALKSYDGLFTADYVK
jgi:DNA-binding protein YbaB